MHSRSIFTCPSGVRKKLLAGAATPRPDLAAVGAAWSRVEERRDEGVPATMEASAIASVLDRTVGGLSALEGAVAEIAGDLDEGVQELQVEGLDPFIGFHDLQHRNNS